MQRSIWLLAGAFLTVVLIAGTQAQVLDSTVTIETRINKDAAASQKRVTSLAQQTADLLAEYRAVVRETEGLKIYNNQLEKVVMDQRAEVVSIGKQMEGLEATNRGVVPLMLEMIETLGQMIESDMPFRLEERRRRVDRLTNMMDQADVTTSETAGQQGSPAGGRTRSVPCR